MRGNRFKRCPGSPIFRLSTRRLIKHFMKRLRALTKNGGAKCAMRMQFIDPRRQSIRMVASGRMLWSDCEERATRNRFFSRNEAPIQARVAGYGMGRPQFAVRLVVAPRLLVTRSGSRNATRFQDRLVCRCRE